MAIIFHDAKEAAKVEAARKQKGRPTYYDAGSQQETEISADFEAAIILVPHSSREEARSRLNAQTQQTDRQKKRDAILNAALRIDAQNANAQDEELQQSVSEFQNFKEEFSTYSGVGEVSTMLRDAQLDLDEVVMAAERAKHRLVCTNVLLERLKTNSISEDLDKERKSWSAVLAEYSAT